MSYNIDDIKIKIQELATLRPDLKSVGYGYKMSNGQMTDELSIVCSVEEKKPLSELSPEEVIPSEVQVGDGVIKTDVIVITNIAPIPCNVGCGDGTNGNRLTIRPLMGGLSISSANTINSVGTMGFIAVHTETQALVGVTNNHVIIQDAFYSGMRNLGGILENEYQPINAVYQNGEAGVVIPGNEIGKSLRYVPILRTGNGINSVDAAIFSVRSGDIDISTSYRQAAEAYNLPLPFATTSEIDNLLSTNPMLYSSGRTTGPKGGASCPLRVFQLSATANINYTLQGSPAGALFGGAIVFVKPETDPSLSTLCINPILPGDSGSALIADFGGTRKIIGLVYAAASVGNDIVYGLACRIDNIVSELGIEAWDGTSKNYVNEASIEAVTINGGNTTKIQSCNGKDYWQAGVTVTNIPCVPTTTTTSTTSTSTTSTSTTTTTTTEAPTTTTTTEEPTTTTTSTSTSTTSTTTEQPTTSSTTTTTTICNCYSIENSTVTTLDYSYIPCGDINLVTVTIGGPAVDYVCSGQLPTGDPGITISGGTTPCSVNQDCTPPPITTTTTTSNCNCQEAIITDNDIYGYVDCQGNAINGDNASGQSICVDINQPYGVANITIIGPSAGCQCGQPTTTTSTTTTTTVPPTTTTTTADPSNFIATELNEELQAENNDFLITEQ